MEKLKSLLALLMLSLILFLPGCQSSEKELVKVTGNHPTLQYQIISARAGHAPFFTNTAGVTTLKHDLRDKSLRASLNQMEFTCHVGNELFHVCENFAGLCRRTMKCAKWKKKWHYPITKQKKCIEKKLIVYTVERDYKFLASVGAECASTLAYPGYERSQ